MPRQPVTREVREVRKPDGRTGEMPKRDIAAAWLLREPAKHVEDEAEKDGRSFAGRSFAETERDWNSLQARQGDDASTLLKETQDNGSEPTSAVRIDPQLEDDANKAARECVKACFLDEKA
jgi:hypothetical protein